MLDAVPVNVAADRAFDQAKARLKLAAEICAIDDHAALQAAASTPENIEARYQQAVLDAVQGRIEDALETFVRVAD